MDSMRNLSTSLPEGSARRRLDQPELLADFKAAALSVTNLYKSAVAVSARARAVGYQDALDDLLAMLDRENMGLMDGEGWRVRQWATERLDDAGQRHSGSDDEAEAEAVKEEEPTAAVERRSSSPVAQRRMSPPLRAASELAEDMPPHRRVVSEPARQGEFTSSSPAPLEAIPTQQFTFRATHPYPTNHDREGSMDVDKDSTSTTTSTPNSAASSAHRASQRSGRRNNRHNRERTNGDSSRTTTLSVNLGAGAGNKRKIPYPDFFDISGINFDGQNHERRDGRGGRDGGGGKRSRHV